MASPLQRQEVWAARLSSSLQRQEAWLMLPGRLRAHAGRTSTSSALSSRALDHYGHYIYYITSLHYSGDVHIRLVL